jgi:hypothetical protein
MPGTLTPNQMYDHECNVLKGWPSMHAVDKSAPLATDESIIAGSVCYLDSNAEFRSGLPDNTVGCFAWPNSDDYDVDGDVGNVQEQEMMALPCVAPFELWTTEYDSAQTYNVGDYLTAWDDNLTGCTDALKGQVRPGTPFVHTLVGNVTIAPASNDYGKMALTLWTYHLPIDLTATSSVA